MGGTVDRRRPTAALGFAPLVGRDRELQRITALLDALARGDGAALLLEGRPGIGKTRLVETAIELANRRGIEVAHATADPSGARRPFHLALAVAGSLAARGDVPPSEELQELVEAVQPARSPGAPIAPGSGRVHVIEAIVGELEARAQHPLVLVVDDLQYADDASLEALRAVLPLTAQTALVVVATGHPGPSTTADRGLRDDIRRLGTVIDLAPLDADAVDALADHLLAGPPAPSLRELLADAAGNPLLVTELVRTLAAEETLRTTGDGVAVPPGTRERLGSDVIELHLASLAETVLDVVRAAAVLGSSATVDHLARVTGLPPLAVADAVGRAATSGLLVEEAGRVRFTHDLVREAVYEHTPSTTRSTLHREAARALAAVRTPAVLVARHAALGASADEAVQWLRLAADDVMTLAPETALDMLDEARTLAGSDPAVLGSIQRARVDSLLGAGRLDEAIRLAELLCDTMPPGEERAELLVRIGGMLFVANRADDAGRRHEQAAEETTRPGLRALALAQRSLTLLASAEFDSAESLARDAATLAEAVGELTAQVVAESVLARIPCFSHRYRDGLPHARRAVELADDDPTGVAHEYPPWFWLGVIALDLDDHATVETAIREGRTRAAARHASWAEPLYAGLAASLAHRRGALDDAAALAETGVSLSVDTGSTQALVWCQSIAALVADRRGDPDERDRWLADAEEAVAGQGAILGIDHYAVAGASALAAAEAAARLADAWDAFEAIGIVNCQPLLAVPLVRAARTTDPERAARVAAALGEAAATSDCAGLAAVADHVRGLLDDDIDLIVDAADRHRDLGRRLDEAEALADAVRSADRHHDARAPSLRSRTTAAFTSCDADAEACLADAGSAEPTPVGRAAPLDGWASLTASERNVVELLAEGLTNSEIAEARHVSRRTIESHLVRVYSKVGYSSRTRLAVEAGERLRR